MRNRSAPLFSHMRIVGFLMTRVSCKVLSKQNKENKERGASLNHVMKDKKVQVGKDQEKAQSEKDFQSKNRGGKKKQNKRTIRYLYNDNISMITYNIGILI